MVGDPEWHPAENQGFDQGVFTPVDTFPHCGTSDPDHWICPSQYRGKGPCMTSVWANDNFETFNRTSRGNYARVVGSQDPAARPGPWTRPGSGPWIRPLEPPWNHTLSLGLPPGPAPGPTLDPYLGPVPWTCPWTRPKTHLGPVPWTRPLDPPLDLPLDPPLDLALDLPLDPPLDLPLDPAPGPAPGPASGSASGSAPPSRAILIEDGTERRS